MNWVEGGRLRMCLGVYVLLASLLPGAALAQSAPHARVWPVNQRIITPVPEGLPVNEKLRESTEP